MGNPPGHRLLSELVELVELCPGPPPSMNGAKGESMPEKIQRAATQLQGVSVASVYQVYSRSLDVVCSGYCSFFGTCLCHLLQMLKAEEKINPYSCNLKKILVVNTCSDTPSLWLLRYGVGQLGRQ